MELQREGGCPPLLLLRELGAPVGALSSTRALLADSGTPAPSTGASELFLRHRLFRSERTGEVIKPEWLKLHYPLYWHYDVLQALLVLGRAGKLGDPRAREALDHIEAKRLPDGRWRSGGSYWRRPGSKGSNVEVVDWGKGGPNEMITLNALRVLKATGRAGC